MMLKLTVDKFIQTDTQTSICYITIKPNMKLSNAGLTKLGPQELPSIKDAF